MESLEKESQPGWRTFVYDPPLKHFNQKKYGEPDCLEPSPQKKLKINDRKFEKVVVAKEKGKDIVSLLEGLLEWGTKERILSSRDYCRLQVKSKIKFDREQTRADLISLTRNAMKGGLISSERVRAILSTPVEPSEPEEGAVANKCKVFIGGLSRKVTHADIRMRFSSFGHIKKALVMRPQNNRCYAFVIYREESAAKQAIQFLNGAMIRGCKMLVSAGAVGREKSDHWKCTHCGFPRNFGDKVWCYKCSSKRPASIEDGGAAMDPIGSPVIGKKGKRHQGMFERTCGLISSLTLQNQGISEPVMISQRDIRSLKLKPGALIEFNLKEYKGQYEASDISVYRVCQ